MNINNQILLVVFLAINLPSLYAQPGDTSPDLTAQVDALFKNWDTKETPGASVAIVKNGKIVYKKGYGMANLEYGIPNSPSTVFHIASVSKQFTVFAIMLLQKDGKLSLEDDVRKYIPEVPDFGKTITLRHLASHTSGMRDQWNLLVMAGWRFDDVITKEHVMKLVRKQKELNYEPGEELLYCNTGFTLLAEVVARVSGQTFAEFTEERIFKPLNMSSTLFYDDHEKIVRNRAYSYRRAEDGTYKKSVLSYANVGATSLFTTVEDLSLWAMNFQQPKVGNNAIFNIMNTQTVLNNGTIESGALGQFVTPYKGLKQIQHGGADAGYRTYLARFPDQNFAVIVFSNEASFNPGGLAHQIADIYLKNDFPKQGAAKSKPAKYLKLSTKELDEYSGTYWYDVENYSRKIYLKDDTLRYWRNERSEDPIVPVAKGEFKMITSPGDFRVKFSKDSQGKSIMVVTIDGVDPSTMVAYQSEKFTQEKLHLYTGTYYSDELSTYYDLKIKDDRLIMEHMRIPDITLTPIMTNRFSGSTYFMGYVEFTRNGENQVTGFKVSNGRVRNLTFQKVID
ncbi:MAG: serine hydrolase domain-containing protein [Cyclobacteriaceae bacterium]